MSTQRLAGKRVLVTGASQGIGTGIARRLSDEGALVCVNTLGPAEASQDLLSSLTVGSFAFQADVRDESQIAAMYASIAQRFGGIDALVNNAGVHSVHSAIDISAEEWDRILDTNLRGAFLCAQHAARMIREQQKGGVIVNIASIHDTVPCRGTAHYCASKAALTMLTRSLAVEWADYGIRVVGIAPGAIETEINRAEIAAFGRHNFEGWIPLRRLGAVDDIASAAAFLLSEEAGYISGITLCIDGAYSLNTIRYDPRDRTHS